MFLRRHNVTVQSLCGKMSEETEQGYSVGMKNFSPLHYIMV